MFVWYMEQTGMFSSARVLTCGRKSRWSYFGQILFHSSSPCWHRRRRRDHPDVRQREKERERKRERERKKEKNTALFSCLQSVFAVFFRVSGQHGFIQQDNYPFVFCLSGTWGGIVSSVYMKMTTCCVVSRNICWRGNLNWLAGSLK